MIYRVFDFDDTLVKSDSVTIVNNPEYGKTILTPGQFAVYKPRRGDTFDFSGFEKVINPKIIKPYMRALQRAIGSPSSKVVAIILTARGDARPIANFLKDIGITKGVKISALGSADPNRKKAYIERLITNGGAEVVEFYDDSYKNIAAVKSLRKKYPNVQINTTHVQGVH